LHFALCAQAFLYGDSFVHRRGWAEDTLLALADAFSVGVSAYGVMPNHYPVAQSIQTLRPFSPA